MIINKNRKYLIFLILTSFVAFAFIHFVSATTSSTDTFFYVYPGTRCNTDGTKWIFGNGTQADSLNNCKIESIAGTCCPIGYNCEKIEGRWNCVANATFICYNYKTTNLCESYSEAVAKSSISQLTGKSCGIYPAPPDSQGCYTGIDNCRCVWLNSSCNPAYETIRACGPNNNQTLGTCVFNDAGSSECENDIMTLKWKASWTGSGSVPAECKDGSKTILCRPTIKLPFFNFINVIVVIGLLVVIYIIYINHFIYKHNKIYK